MHSPMHLTMLGRLSRKVTSKGNSMVEWFVVLFCASAVVLALRAVGRGGLTFEWLLGAAGVCLLVIAIFGVG